MDNEALILVLLNDLTRPGLVRRYAARKLATSGTKEELARRLVEERNVEIMDKTMNTDNFADAETRSSTNDEGVLPVHSDLVRTPYSFRDVEDGLETHGNDIFQDFSVWLNEFEDISRMARWTQDQMLVMMR